MLDVPTLVTNARAGDRVAFDRVVQATWDEVYAFAAARSASLEEADGVTHETFVEAWFALARYEERDAFVGWMKGIARNLLLRRRHARGHADVAAVAGLIADRLGDDDGAGEDTAVRLVQLRDCLERLPHHLRLLAKKRFDDDLPVATICQHLRRSRASVANALTRLRSSLRACVERTSPTAVP